MSDDRSGLPPAPLPLSPTGLAPGLGGGPGLAAFLQVFQNIVLAINAETQALKTWPIFAATGSQLPGTITNDNAVAGNVGEELETVVASGAAIGLSTGTPATIASRALTAGDWDVWGYIGFTGAVSTTVNYLVGSISLVNNTLDQTRSRWASQVPGGGAVFNILTPQQFACGQDRYPLAGPATVYLVAQAGFGVSTCSAFGTIIGRRRR